MSSSPIVEKESLSGGSFAEASLAAMNGLREMTIRLLAIEKKFAEIKRRMDEMTATMEKQADERKNKERSHMKIDSLNKQLEEESVEVQEATLSVLFKPWNIPPVGQAGKEEAQGKRDEGEVGEKIVIHGDGWDPMRDGKNFHDFFVRFL